MIKRIQKLNNQIQSYILRGNEYNTYIISDLEILGLESGIIELYCGMSDKDICYILMRYGQSFVIYAEQSSKIDLSEFKVFMQQYDFEIRITGKREVIEKIASCFPDAELDHNRFAVITPNMLKLYHIENEDFLLLKNCTAKQVICGYSEIEEYKKRYQDEEWALKRIETNNLNGRYYGIKNCDKEKIVAMVCSAAESKDFAMISEVGTAAEYRNRGFSKVLVSNLCKDLFDMGKKKLCIFYSNSIAKQVYEAVGFQEDGEYSILRYKR